MKRLSGREERQKKFIVVLVPAPPAILRLKHTRLVYLTSCSGPQKMGKRAKAAKIQREKSPFLTQLMQKGISNEQEQDSLKAISVTILLWHQLH